MILLQKCDGGKCTRSLQPGLAQDRTPFGFTSFPSDTVFDCDRFFVFYCKSQPYYRSQCSFYNNAKDLEGKKQVSLPTYLLFGHEAILIS
jgi:hypothetical protein